MSAVSIICQLYQGPGQNESTGRVCDSSGTGQNSNKQRAPVTGSPQSWRERRRIPGQQLAGADDDREVKDETRKVPEELVLAVCKLYAYTAPDQLQLAFVSAAAVGMHQCQLQLTCTEPDQLQLATMHRTRSAAVGKARVYAAAAAVCLLSW